MPHVVRQPGVLAGTQIAVFLALVHAVNDVLTAMLGALLPTLQVRFTAGTTTLAVHVAAFSISSSVTQPVLGLTGLGELGQPGADRVPRQLRGSRAGRGRPASG